MSSSDPVVIIGAGPAGLTAAHELSSHDAECVVLEATDDVGGISRTVERDGWRFDIGGHRFFTKVPEVEALWNHFLPDGEFLLRPRMSRIFYRGRLFDYPLKASNALRNLGLVEAVRCVLSYVLVRLRPPKDQSNFEGWVAARFGWRLYRIFFKTYTEKVWGVPATEIQADWAAQRIKNLSLVSAIANALLPKRGQTDITTLIDEFKYPKYGPGQMWQAARDLVRSRGVRVQMETAVTAIERRDGAAASVAFTGPDGAGTVAASAVVSSMPMRDLVRCISPAVPDEVRVAAEGLRYRDFLTVALVVPQEFSFPDNWIYIHDPSVRVGRVQNFGSWSPYLVKDGRTCLGSEYFVTENDELWDASDEELVALASKELRELGLITGDVVEAGYVVRVPKAYPVYDDAYRGNVDTIREWLAAEMPNVHLVGRNGMHRYNNADHSMMTALLVARNILGADPPHDVWAVNVEEEYHEEDSSSRGSGSGTGRDAPLLPARPAPRGTEAGTVLERTTPGRLPADPRS